MWKGVDGFFRSGGGGKQNIVKFKGITPFTILVSFITRYLFNSSMMDMMIGNGIGWDGGCGTANVAARNEMLSELAETDHWGNTHHPR